MLPSPELSSPEEVRALLDRSSSGDVGADEQLSQDLYRELRDIAGRLFLRERRDHSLQPTAVVHEAWLRVVGVVTPTSRARFLGLAAKAMRHVLIDHARRRDADKRGAGQVRVALDELLEVYETNQPDVLVLDELLQRLGREDEVSARVVELRFFAGLTLQETGEVIGVSTTGVHRIWEFARAWLRNELDGADH